MIRLWYIVILFLFIRVTWRICKERYSTESRIEKNIFRSWEMLWILMRWEDDSPPVLELTVAHRLCEAAVRADCDVCFNSALHRQQWTTVRRSLLSWYAPLREVALRSRSWSEIRSRLQWVELKDSWSNCRRRLLIWGGETLSWRTLHTHKITPFSSR